MSTPPPPETVVKNRLLGFLIWQSIPSTLAFLFTKTLLSISTPYFSPPSFLSLLSFSAFHLSLLLFSASLSAISSPAPFSPLSLLPRRRLLTFLRFAAFVACSALSGFLAVVAACGYGGAQGVGRFAFRGFLMGFVFGLFYVCMQRWVLEFPIIQRPPYFSFKMGVPLAVKRALKLSSAAFFVSGLLLLFLPEQLRSRGTVGQFITEQIILFIGSFSTFFCWELNHHLHQVLHTKRFAFAPPKGSAAAETNPSEPLLAALEESPPYSLPQCLAYLDLCMVCENNVDTWRRAAFFEETGETYKRVVTVCLRPLENVAAKLAEGLEGFSSEKDYQLSRQLLSPTDLQMESKYYESLNNFQLLAWCARAVSSLTARSHEEDRFGIAQLTGSNASVVSTLLSCLLAVETFMGKKTNLPPQHQLMGPAGIKWATPNTGRRDVTIKRRGGPQHAKAYAMADVLRTSVYGIVSAFHNEMLSSAKAGLLEKDWIVKSKPIFGTHELLVQKLRLFLDFRAC
ncbi:hypothetical protein Tsubulata_045827 [Turnera subulata]|uniref:Nucleoporin protein Ndc1-Nup n=1 Tax=Turnera subulata TaxID=218843 RepID=A0A9Q0GC93_9ROSI|nr:hypothetical protein Tsubulata_045827 [Turnera subulata]